MLAERPDQNNFQPPPTYLKDTRGLEIKTNAVTEWLANLLEGSVNPETLQRILAAALAGIPPLFGGFGSLIAGRKNPCSSLSDMIKSCR
jgi:hypothetical protein